MSEQFIIGIDLGGTKIAAAAFDIQGNRLGKMASLPTMAQLRPAATLMNLRRVVKQAKAEAGVDGVPAAVGMGSSGPLDTKRRILQDRDSLPHLVGFRIGDYCSRELGADLHLENDAACFALGEAVRGAGRGAAVVLGVTLGTGFGCGIIIHGSLYSGATGNAGEVAYCRVGDSDFDHACAGQGVVAQYRRLAGSKAAPGVTAREVGAMAESGDRQAADAWRAFGRDVGAAVGTLCAAIDPSVVVLGGSVGSRLPLFERELAESARALLLGAAKEGFSVVPARLGSAAGVTGAAELALQRLAKTSTR